MKKLLALAVVAGGVLFAVKRKKQGKAQADADAWRETTAPVNGASLNGNAKLAESARKN